jgi:hypothetical protein
LITTRQPLHKEKSAAGEKRARFGQKRLSRACPGILREEAVKRRNGGADVPVVIHQPIAGREEDPIDGTGDLRDRIQGDLAGVTDDLVFEFEGWRTTAGTIGLRTRALSERQPQPRDYLRTPLARVMLARKAGSYFIKPSRCRKRNNQTSIDLTACWFW